MDAPIYCYL